MFEKLAEKTNAFTYMLKLTSFFQKRCKNCECSSMSPFIVSCICM